MNNDTTIVGGTHFLITHDTMQRSITFRAYMAEIRYVVCKSRQQRHGNMIVGVQVHDINVRTLYQLESSVILRS